MTPLLTVEDLETVFHTDRETVRAVDGISLTVERGETVGIVGESGSGKTVTARSIMGLVEEPGEVSGSIRLDGEELVGPDGAGWDDLRGDRIAMIFQDPATSLNPVYTVGNQIKEALALHQGTRGRAATEEAAELLRQVGIPDPERRLGEYPHQFSGGMAQRAVIAMALACDPDLLIADEPTTALDVTIQAQVLDVLADIQRERNLAMLFITHDMAVISQVTDRLNVMYAGEIVESGPIDAILEDPAHPYTRGLLECIPARNAGARLHTIEGEVPTPNEPATACRFAPRCPEAHDACREIHPEPVALESRPEDAATNGAGQATDRRTACLLYPEDEPQTDRLRRHARGETE
ncbi:ABC transporter ATP-binding protein [Halobacteriales archaeon QH_10_67_13]|nr:MAG: ABC transporter ATP-binding protein [Halobacteriales archaeon QH_10_67_13]